MYEKMEPLGVVNFVVNQGHGVRGLAAMGLTHVPSNYVQPPAHASKVVSDKSIPIINVSDWDDGCTRGAICAAATRYGFFQVEPRDTSGGDGGGEEGGMPTSEKVKYKRDGFVGAKLGTRNKKVLEWKDYLSLRYSSQEAASQTWPPICK